MMKPIFLLTILFPLIAAQNLVPNPQDRDPSVFCKQCWERRNQKDYYANEFNCTTYYHCFKNGSNIEGILRPCADGLRFEESIPACVPMISPGRCDDPCSNKTTMMEGWWMGDQCGIFYQCSNYYSIRMCCPPNHRFNMSWGDCMYDKSCNEHNDECGKRSITVPMWTPRIDGDRCIDVQYGVTRKEFPGDRTKYIVVLTPYKDTEQNVTMDCPPATEFDFNTCKCSIHANYTEEPAFEKCLLDVIGKEKTIIDDSHMKFWVDRDGVKTTAISNGEHAIDCPGNKHVEVPGMQGLSLGFRVTVSAWIKPKCTTDGGVIFSNRGEGMSIKSSISFTEVDVNTVWNVRMTLRTVKNMYTRELPVICDEWNFAAVTYDGMTFRWLLKFGTANSQEWISNQVVSAAAGEWEAIIYWMVHCPLSICENINDDTDPNHVFIGYDGLVNHVRICRYVMSQNELRALANSEEAAHPFASLG